MATWIGGEGDRVRPQRWPGLDRVVRDRIPGLQRQPEFAGASGQDLSLAAGQADRTSVTKVEARRRIPRPWHHGQVIPCPARTGERPPPGARRVQGTGACDAFESRSVRGHGPGGIPSAFAVDRWPPPALKWSNSTTGVIERVWRSKVSGEICGSRHRWCRSGQQER